jgi:D-threo-aldose 1-dehydrogenase
MNSAEALAWLIERCDLDCVLVAGRYTLLDGSAAETLFPLCCKPFVIMKFRDCVRW